MAVGVLGDDSVTGSYYIYKGEKYFYLETTAEGWDLGDIPDDYKDESVTIVPITPRAVLYVEQEASISSSSFDSYVDINVTLENGGSEYADDVEIYIALETSDVDKVWDQVTSDGFYLESTLNIYDSHMYPTKFSTQFGKEIEIRLIQRGSTIKEKAHKILLEGDFTGKTIETFVKKYMQEK